ncbi:MAG: 50S ribosomal protein L17 [Bacilli bacterium]|jgi:large subunit ribosomal protein L17|nr:50S ribosomal protein L17 [Bacilli bacterium]
MSYRKLGTRTSEQRRIILANLVRQLIQHEKIETTEARAKEARKIMDKVITYGKIGTVEARRDALALLMNDKEAVKKVFNDLVKRYEKRSGGYTRILKLKERRGDDALMVILELV